MKQWFGVLLAGTLLLTSCAAPPKEPSAPLEEDIAADEVRHDPQGDQEEGLTEEPLDSEKEEETQISNGRDQYEEERTDHIVECPFPKEEDWYLISSAKDLRVLRELIDQQAAFADGTKAKNGKYRLTQSVDLTEELHPELGWIPIGSHLSQQRRTSRQWTSFSGEFDGGMHPITGLVIDAPELIYEPQGLFGHTSNAVIRNVVIEGCSITGSGYVGGVVGKSLSSNSEHIALVEHCYVTGTVKGNDFVGGVVGSGESVERCGFEGRVTGISHREDTSYAVGGVAGDVKRVSQCFARGEVRGFRYVGGVCGETLRAFDSYFIGELTGVEEVGGIAGSCSVVQYCYTAAQIGGYESVGGIAGHIADRYNTEPETISAVASNLLAAGSAVFSTPKPREMDENSGSAPRRILGSVGAGTGTDAIYALESMELNPFRSSLSYSWDGDHFPDTYLTDISAWQEILTSEAGWDAVWKQQEGCYPQLMWELGDPVEIMVS